MGTWTLNLVMAETSRRVREVGGRQGELERGDGAVESELSHPPAVVGRKVLLPTGALTCFVPSRW